MEDRLYCGFNRGDRVQVIGVSGYGTVVKNQGASNSVQVKWDDSKGIAHPLGANLRKVGWTDFPPKEGSTGVSEAVKLIEEKRDELVKKRNTLNHQILQLEEAIKILVD